MIELLLHLTIINCSTLSLCYWARYAWLLTTMTTQADFARIEASLLDDWELFGEVWTLLTKFG